MTSRETENYIKRMISGVPESFLDSMFAMVGPDTLPSDCCINLEVIAKWLVVSKRKLMLTLRRSYVENVDYTYKKIPNPKRIKYGNNYTQVLVSPKCFKELAMRSNSEHASLVRQYFIAVEEAFIKYRSQLIKGLEADVDTLLNNQKPRIPNARPGYVYIIQAQNNLSLHKVQSLLKTGKSKQLQSRMDGYNTGNANNMNFLYQIQTDNMDAVEKCIHLMCKKYQYRKRKEVFQINIDIMKNVMNHCAAASEAATRVPGKKINKQDGGYFAVVTEEKLI